MTRLSNLRGALAGAALATLAVGGSATPASAQILGVKGGVSVASASLDTSATFDKENRTGFVGGAFLTWSVGPLGFQPEVSYARMGFGERGAADGLKLGYLTGTALLKLGIPLVVAKPSVFGGLAYGIRTNCEVDGTSCSDAGLDVKRTDTSAVFGGDLAVYIGKASLWADGRYNIGLQDINESSDIFRSVKNRAWQLQAGIGFKLD